MGALTLNGNSLQTANIVTAEIDHSGGPGKNFDPQKIAGANKSIISDYDYDPKIIVIEGTLNHTIASMDALIDTFKSYFVGKDKNFDIEQGDGSTRRYIVTPSMPDIKRPGGLGYATWTAKLTAAIPFGTDTAKTTLANRTAGTAITSSPTNVSITVGGNVEFQYPIITATLNSGTGLSSATMSIGNNNNGQVLNITRTWMAGDVVVIDPYAETVTVNNVETYFTGAMPIFEAGSGAVNYADTFLTRNVSLLVEQYRYWL